MELVKGPFTKHEKEYINKYRDKQSVEEIAKYLRRDFNVVKLYIGKLKSKNKQDEHDVSPAKKIDDYKESVAYKQLRSEFFGDELAYFDEQFDNLRSQFGHDLLPTEITQIRKAITLEIEMSRIAKQMKSVLEDIDFAEKQIDTFKRKYNDLDDLPDGVAEKLEKLRTRIEMGYASKKMLTNEKMELESKHQKLMVDLKATRDQRFSKIESNKKNFLDLIRMLQDEQIRDREGRQIAQMTAATEKELARLSKPHTYADGVVDLPILDADTLRANND